jgi:transcriptional regulator with XRE-family HTH domain
MGLSQHSFSKIGGVAANAQGKYESGSRTPNADYLAAVAVAGVDVVYVLTGVAVQSDVFNLSGTEAQIITGYRALGQDDKDAIGQLTKNMAYLLQFHKLRA